MISQQFNLSPNIIEKIQESFDACDIDKVGEIIEGTITNITKDKVYVDVGLKAEGCIDKSEFFLDENNLSVGSKIKVFFAGFDIQGNAIKLNRDRAIREESWIKVQNAFDANEPIDVIVFDKLKSGNKGVFVDYYGVIGIIPSNQQIEPTAQIIGKTIKVDITSLDESKKIAYLSQKTFMDKETVQFKIDFIATHNEGDIILGKVKNIIDSGIIISADAMVDIFIPNSDLSWYKIGSPSDHFTIGQEVEFKIMKIDKSSNKIFASIKHLTQNPWIELCSEYALDQVITAKVVGSNDHGFTLELKPQLVGLLHFSELSYNLSEVDDIKSNISIGKDLNVKIVDIDPEKQRISLSIKRIILDPYKDFVNNNIVDSIVEVEVASITNYGIFVLIDKELKAEALIRAENISWLPNLDYDNTLSKYKVGDTIRVKYIGRESEYSYKIKMSIKHLTDDPFVKNANELKIGSKVKCKVIGIKNETLEVSLFDDTILGYVEKNDLSKNKNDRKLENFTIGQSIEAKIMSPRANVRDDRFLTLSIKELEESEYKEIMKKYTKKDNSGASIANLLESAINEN